VLVIAIAAAEIAVGLAIVLAVFRTRRTVNLDEVTSMRG
jgi:NADH-quinone oxidoreductase subunit K